MRRLAFCAVGWAIYFLGFQSIALFAGGPELTSIEVAARQRARGPAARASLNHRFPLYFVENRGPVSARAAYSIHGADKAFHFQPGAVTMLLKQGRERESAQLDLSGLNDGTPRRGTVDGPTAATTVVLEFIDANPAALPVGEDLSPAVFSYFTGPRERWMVGLKSYTRLVYHDVWPGIDLVYSASVDRLKYMFVVKPGADPSRIKLRYRGVESVSVDTDGALLVRTAAESFHDERPTAQQDFGGTVEQVRAEYLLLAGASGADHSYGFELGPYNRDHTLIIDPAILVFSGLIGGSGDDRAKGIAVDPAGNSYVTGETDSLLSSFPTVAGPDSTHNGGVDAFVAKIDPTGTRLLYAGFLGGAGDDRGNAIAVDALGSAYIAGETSSTQSSFPVMAGPDQSHNGLVDGFVAKISADGTDLIYAGYIGGAGTDRALAIAVDSLLRAYVAGEASSSGSSFPDGLGITGLSSFDSSQNGGIDGFVARVAPDGGSFEYAGFLGGSGTDRAHAVAVDSSSRAYVTGATDSTAASFPTGAGFGSLTSFDPSHNGSVDAFVVRIDAGGQSLEYAGYIGGSAADGGNGIAVDGTDHAYVAGETSSSEDSFPDGNGIGALAGPGRRNRGGIDAFVAKISSDGDQLRFAGYFGGSSEDRAHAIALAPGCSADCPSYITGETRSARSSFFTGSGFLEFSDNAGANAFVARIESDGSLFGARTFGGSGDDRGRGIALDAQGAVYVTGESSATRSFPIKGSFGKKPNLGDEAFAAKFCFLGCADLSVSKTDSPDPVTVGSNVTYTITVTNHGPETATDAALTDDLPSAALLSVTPSAGSCTVSGTIDCDLGDLADGATATVTMVATTAAAGKLTSRATVSSAAIDTDPANNSVQQQTLVTLPDLILKQINAAAAAIPGSSVTVNDVTTNKGKVAVGPSTTSFFLSADQRFDAGDTFLGSRAVAALLPKQSDSGSSLLVIPPATALGRYFLIGVADAAAGIPETREGNSKGRSLNLTLPDLTAQVLQSPRSAAAGATISIRETIRNNSLVGADASGIEYYLSSDAQLDSGDASIGSRSVPALAAGARNGATAMLTIPPGITPGIYFILAVADPGGAVAETNEGNNVGSRRITITP